MNIKSRLFSIITILLVLSLFLGSCTKEKEKEDTCVYCGLPVSSCTCEPLEVDKSTFNLFDKTIWQTPAYLFKTNKPGPGIVIVGGTHGDETAGWNAGLQLVNLIENEKKLCGNILIIPQVNILADQREQRFVGKIDGMSNNSQNTVTIDGVKAVYTDLNRSFEVGRSKYASADTIKLSDEIVKVIADFDKIYGADYIVDLHEARRSGSDGYSEDSSLGDTLIYNNEPLTVRKIIKNYNTVYRPESEPLFGSEPATQNGSFSMYFTTNYPNSVVFTIETNRQFDYDLGINTIPLETRVRQQLNILRSMFDIAWNR